MDHIYTTCNTMWGINDLMQVWRAQILRHGFYLVHPHVRLNYMLLSSVNMPFTVIIVLWDSMKPGKSFSP